MSSAGVALVFTVLDSMVSTDVDGDPNGLVFAASQCIYPLPLLTFHTLPMSAKHEQNTTLSVARGTVVWCLCLEGLKH